jgi:hypothetical protein
MNKTKVTFRVKLNTKDLYVQGADCLIDRGVLVILGQNKEITATFKKWLYCIREDQDSE